jgi:hypothetical protein
MFDPDQFDSIAFRNMPIPDRVKLCRVMAVRCRVTAERFHGTRQATYFRIAAEWDILGSEIEFFGAPENCPS